MGQFRANFPRLMLTVNTIEGSGILGSNRSQTARRPTAPIDDEVSSHVLFIGVSQKVRSELLNWSLREYFQNTRHGTFTVHYKYLSSSTRNYLGIRALQKVLLVPSSGTFCRVRLPARPRASDFRTHSGRSFVENVPSYAKPTRFDSDSLYKHSLGGYVCT